MAELAAIEPEGGDGDDDKPLLLVIDDNDDLRKLLGELLHDEYRVLAASNGQDGLRMAARHVPDIIICDVMMPVMDGLECCRLIKDEISTSHIPVLMLTACSMDEQRAQGYDSGADGYLAKPFNADVLRSRCRSLIANRRRIRQLWASDGLPSASAGMNVDNPKAARGDMENEFYSRFIDIVNARWATLTSMSIRWHQKWGWGGRSSTAKSSSYQLLACRTVAADASQPRPRSADHHRPYHQRNRL